MNSAYGSDAPRQMPIGGHGPTLAMPPIAPPSSASRSAALNHLYHHHQPQPSLRHPHSAAHSPTQSQAPPPHLHPQAYHYPYHQLPHLERDYHQLPPLQAPYDTQPSPLPHSQHVQHNALPPRPDPSEPSHSNQHHVGEHKDQSQRLPDHPHRPHESFTNMQASILVHSESQQIGTADMMIPFSKVDEATGRRYHLDVAQQPRRARMCGFGDKDRRPITPPPCVRLVITDVATGKELDSNDIDFSMFVLNVDLWSEEGTREVNLVRSSTNSPPMSSAASYPFVGENSQSAYGQNNLPPNRDATYPPPQGGSYASDYQPQSNYTQASSSSSTYPPGGTYGPPQQFFPQHQSQASSSSFRSFLPDSTSLTRMAVIGGQPQGMFTRNLIGSLAASAFRLADTEERIGIWFVLQDLSVRTEGPFRLRFSFVDVSARGGMEQNGSKVNTGRAPILASCFSEVFNVYSAKKFPGVCESTPLSKAFAAQGIKIPIRKDANLRGGDEEDDYGD
ncbi:velvet factor domain-containing protein [Trichoderma austrokoningii]